MPRLYQANFLLDDEHNNSKSASRMGEPSGFGRFASEFGHSLQSDTMCIAAIFHYAWKQRMQCAARTCDFKEIVLLQPPLKFCPLAGLCEVFMKLLNGAGPTLCIHLSLRF